MFADLVPADSGVQEYPWTDLPGSEAAAGSLERANVAEAQAGGMTFRLSQPGGDLRVLHAGQMQPLRVSVTTPNGQPVTRLEPVMAAFAHLVGFYDDGRTVVHLHPIGVEVTDPNTRGGPELEFKFYPPKSGFIKLFCQVQVEGKSVFAPFGLTVGP